jgi:hypothetical protein
VAPLQRVEREKERKREREREGIGQEGEAKRPS